MAYIIEQKNKKNNRIYVYEVDAYWDPKKQQSRQRRKYLGVKDPKTKEVEKKYNEGSRVRTARDFGGVYFLRSISEKLKLTSCLKESFTNNWEEILDLAMFKIISGQSFYIFDDWSTSNYVRSNLSSQSISDLLEDIDDKSFLDLWNKKHSSKDAAYFDITSISSYSSGRNACEYGYNRDKERLKQINLGIISSSISQLPLAYKSYPGSVSDVSTITNLIPLAKSWGIKSMLLILDCGFSSKENIEKLKANKLDFITRLNPKNLNYDRLIDMFCLSNENLFSFNGDAFFYQQHEITIGKTSVFAHVFHSETKKNLELIKFLEKISEIEALVNDKTKEELQDIIKMQDLKDFFIFNKGVLKRNIDAIDKKIHCLGKFILLTNKKLYSSKFVLESYRNKDLAEKLFDNLKTEIHISRLRTKKDSTTNGSIFISFLALILYSHLVKVLHNNKLTVQKILASLTTLKVIDLNNSKSILSEITKKNKDIFTLFDLEIPTTPRY